MLVAICILPAPELRAKYHELFEFSHRFGGWAMLAMAWANTFILAQLHSRRHGLAYESALAESPVFWMLVGSTCFAVWPWLLLRRVPISVQRPSDHVTIVRLHSKRTPPVGTTRAISRHPLHSWHPFACVPAATGEDGYRMMISRVGEWTSAFIDNAPSHIWVRGISTPGVANAKRLFHRVLYVATGSGIGPTLGHLLADSQGAKLVWVTRNPRETYGDAVVDEITTGTAGRRDLEHKHPGQTGRVRVELSGLRRLRRGRSDHCVEPIGHRRGRQRLRATGSPGLWADLGLLRRIRPTRMSRRAHRGATGEGHSAVAPSAFRKRAAELWRDPTLMSQLMIRPFRPMDDAMVANLRPSKRNTAHQKPVLA